MNNLFTLIKMYFPVMKGTRRKRNLIVDIIKTRSQEIHKLLSSTPQETWKLAFWERARARWESSSPIVTVWHHFVLSTNGKSRAAQTRRQKLYRSAKPLFSLIVQTSPHLILDLSRDGQWKGKKGFPQKKFSFFSTARKALWTQSDKNGFFYQCHANLS